MLLDPRFFTYGYQFQASGDPVTVFVFDYTDKSPDEVSVSSQ